MIFDEKTRCLMKKRIFDEKKWILSPAEHFLTKKSGFWAQRSVTTTAKQIAGTILVPFKDNLLFSQKLVNFDIRKSTCFGTQFYPFWMRIGQNDVWNMGNILIVPRTSETLNLYEFLLIVRPGQKNVGPKSIYIYIYYKPF